MERYTIGLDFGTESGRAVLVRLRDGAVISTSVYEYPDGVIDEKLPGTGERLPSEWALQNPRDWLATVEQTVPRLLSESGIDPASILGIGIDFTSCTVLPTKADGTPL